MKVWYIPEGIANIFLMNELEKISYPYDSWEGKLWCTPTMDQ